MLKDVVKANLMQSAQNRNSTGPEEPDSLQCLRPGSWLEIGKSNLTDDSCFHKVERLFTVLFVQKNTQNILNTFKGVFQYSVRYFNTSTQHVLFGENVLRAVNLMRFLTTYNDSLTCLKDILYFINQTGHRGWNLKYMSYLRQHRERGCFCL